ncbi:MAG: ABC transporter ATP-binding protein [Opitutaceae bacterium]|nr:ABC transporter ATP-binding protein [Opitutaceae bacterium]
MADAAEITIEVSDLVKHFGPVAAVNGISFTVRRGEIVGFLGPNGAGKSTTMRILTGYLPATSGAVRICGLPLASQTDAIKRHIGYMPENNPLPEDLRIAEYLWFRGRLKDIPRSRLRSRLDEVLELCDLKRYRHRIIGRLSKGTRQRVGIAEAIMAEPAVIIMDEPTIGLDPHQILIVRDLISHLRGRMSVIISSHILPEIEVTCDRVLIISGGRIVAQGSPSELRSEIFGHTSYRLEMAGDPATLPPQLAAIHPTLRITATDEQADDQGFREFILRTDADTDLGETLLQTLLHAGFRVRSLVRQHPSLEDVFLTATRRSWDATLPDRETRRDGSPPPPAF